MLIGAEPARPPRILLNQKKCQLIIIYFIKLVNIEEYRI
jgi:hypothetical protein